MSGTITAATELGMLGDTERLRIISHNLANVSTVAYKRQIGVTQPFDMLLSANGLRTGTAARPSTGLTEFTDRSAGTLTHTGNPLDLAIEGDGFFVIDTGAQEVYTRQGTLRLDTDGTLVNVRGQAVETLSGPVRLTSPAPAIDAQGNIRDNGSVVAQLKVVTVTNPQSLVPLGNGTYAATDSTATQPADAARVRQGYTEQSNVITMHEMINLIETMRHFETSQKFLQGYDGMLQRALADLGSY
jgi:flagellar basal-body rod protein FlgG